MQVAPSALKVTAPRSLHGPTDPQLLRCCCLQALFSLHQLPGTPPCSFKAHMGAPIKPMPLGLAGTPALVCLTSRVNMSLDSWT